MKNIISLIAFILVCTIYTANGQDTAGIITSAVNHIEEQLLVYPQEKIYLHTDKPEYISGEKVWFRAYLLDAATHRPATGSRYIYVELISNGQDTATCRVKIKPDDNGFYHGYMVLPENLPGGDYRLQAYTRYMAGQYPGDFYTKDIRIFLPGEKDMETKKTNRKNTDYELQFFPEGGHLLEGTTCKVAFKAVNNLGLGEDITGTLVDENNRVVDSINSYHKGMGFFYIKPVAGKKYSMQCINRQGKSKSFELPQAMADTYALSVVSNGPKLYVSISKPGGKTMPDSLILLAHTDGLVQYAAYIDPAVQPVVFNPKDFPSGILHLLLFNKQLDILSERLVFVRNNDQAGMILQTGKKEYGTREHITITAKASDQEHNYLPGSFSVSVIDGNDLHPDTISTILTSMLLTSDLRGYIEDAGFYFRQSNRQTSTALDILMLTQGWRRYDIPQVIKGNYSRPVIFPENGQVVTGRALVEGAFKDTPLKDGKVVLFVPDAMFIDETETGPDGNFRFEYFELPDSMKYIVQAGTNKGGKGIRLELDRETFPKADIRQDFPGQEEITPNAGYIAKADQQYTLENGVRMIHIKEVTISAQRINKKKSIYAMNPNHSFDDQYIRDNHIRDFKSLIYRTPGVRIAGNAIIMRESVSLGTSDKNTDKKNGRIPALIIIDGTIMSRGFDDPTYTSTAPFELVNIDNIERVDFVQGARAGILGSRAAGGAVVITTKGGIGKGPSFTPPWSEHKKTFIPLGYQEPAEFYSPSYATEDEKNRSKPDLRTTIYWKPDVVLSPEGEAKIDLYAANTPSTYYVVIEGVADNGKLIHEISTIQVR